MMKTKWILGALLLCTLQANLAVAGDDTVYTKQMQHKQLKELVAGKDIWADSASYEDGAAVGFALWQRHFDAGTNWYFRPRKKKRSTRNPVESEEARTLKRICSPLWGKKISSAKMVCLVLLMDQDVYEWNGESIFELAKESSCGFPLRRLALVAPLAREEAARAVEKQWQQASQSVCTNGGCGCHSFPKPLKRNRRRMRILTRRYRDQRLNILNALSWLGEEESKKWIRDVALLDSDKRVVKRATIVLDLLSPPS